MYLHILGILLQILIHALFRKLLAFFVQGWPERVLFGFALLPLFEHFMFDLHLFEQEEYLLYLHRLIFVVGVAIHKLLPRLLDVLELRDLQERFHHLRAAVNIRVQ